MRTAVAAGVLSAGIGGNASVSEDGLEGGDEDGRPSRGITLADRLVELSTEELRQLPNEEVQRPSNPEIGGGDHYDPKQFEGADGYPHGGRVTRSDADYVTATGAESRARSPAPARARASESRATP